MSRRNTIRNVCVVTRKYPSPASRELVERERPVRVHEEREGAELRGAKRGGHEHELAARRQPRQPQRALDGVAGREARLVQQRRELLGRPRERQPRVAVAAPRLMRDGGSGGRRRRRRRRRRRATKRYLLGVG